MMALTQRGASTSFSELPASGVADRDGEPTSEDFTEQELSGAEVLKLDPVRRILHLHLSDSEIINLAVALEDLCTAVNESLLLNFCHNSNLIVQSSDQLLAKLPKEIIERCLCFNKFDVAFIERLFGKIDWTGKTPYKTQYLPIRFIRDHEDDLCWRYLCRYHSNRNLILHCFPDKVSLKELIGYTHLSEGIIEEVFGDDNEIRHLCKYQEVSEAFIERHLGKLDQEAVCRYQQLSEHFLKRHLYHLPLDVVCIYQKLPMELIEKIYSAIGDKNLLIKHQHLTEEFIERHLQDFNIDTVFNIKMMSRRFVEKYDLYWKGRIQRPSNVLSRWRQYDPAYALIPQSLLPISFHKRSTWRKMALKP